MKKVIWLDIAHPAQFNFYKNIIYELETEYNILVSFIKRGRLGEIIRKEFEGKKRVEIFPVGSYHYNQFSVYWNANFLRFFKLFSFCVKKTPDIQVGNVYLSGLVAKMFNIPSIQFGDDPEAITYKLQKVTSTELYYAMYEDSQDKNVTSFNSLKEWSYLSPEYFTPNVDALAKYGIQKKQYIFVREVITSSLNYKTQISDSLAKIADSLQNYKVVLSLEDKSKKKIYPDDWIILQEPVPDIHSLLYFSSAVVSTGDSMAREGAILGVPSLYCGKRDMNAVDTLKKFGMIHQIDLSEVQHRVDMVVKNKIDFPPQDDFRHKLLENWVDVVSFVKNRINANLT